jgi:electron transport complex protein RnfG
MDTTASPGDTSRQPPEKPAAPAWRLLATLGVAGGIAGLLIVLTFDWAQPRIEAHQARVLRLAVQEVLLEPARYEALFVYDGAITATLPAGVDSVGVERVYLGYDATGAPVGFAVVTSKAGFQDQIRLIFGYDPRTGRLLGMKVLESKETPGLGDKIEKDSSFVAEFAGVASPLVGVKSGAGRGEANEVDMITGATISSRTLIDAINAALARLGPMLGTYATGGGQ